MKHKDKLREAYNHSHDDLLFEDWLVRESEYNHKSSKLMAGDLGKAFSDIGTLQAENKELKKSVERITKLYEQERDCNQMFKRVKK